LRRKLNSWIDLSRRKATETKAHEHYLISSNLIDVITASHKSHYAHVHLSSPFSTGRPSAAVFADLRTAPPTKILTGLNTGTGQFAVIEVVDVCRFDEVVGAKIY
jgi:hypothetical protein